MEKLKPYQYAGWQYTTEAGQHLTFYELSQKVVCFIIVSCMLHSASVSEVLCFHMDIIMELHLHDLSKVNIKSGRNSRLKAHTLEWY